MIDVRNLILKGKFQVEHIRKGKIIDIYDFNNGIVDVGVNSLWDIMFGAGTQITSWFIGLIDNASPPSLLTTDTLAAHSGWVENTSYSGNRKAWNVAAAAARAKNSSSNSAFTINATVNIYGLFVCSLATGTGGTLWSTGAFPNGPVACVNADVLNCTYGVSGQ